MANTKISQLSTWTGNTTGFYIVVDNSGLTQTYKTTKETLIGNYLWTSAGTIQSNGWSATTTSPTIGVNTKNNMSYRQAGGKDYELSMVFDVDAGGSNGSGDYIFTLPAGLSFDTSVQRQTAYQGGVGSNSWLNAEHALPAGGLINNGTVGGQVYPVIWTARTFRVLTITYGTGIQWWSSGFYGLGGVINMSFTFTAL